MTFLIILNEQNEVAMTMQCVHLIADIKGNGQISPATVNVNKVYIFFCFSVPFIGTRHVFAIMAFFGFFNVYAMRVNLSVAIVAMVNNTALNSSHPGSKLFHPPSPLAASSHRRGSNITTTCMEDIEPSEGNSTDPDAPQDGPFDWDEETQSLVLGCFFYGYVLTQIPAGFYAEKYGGHKIFGFGILFTSILTILMPLAAKTNFYFLIFIRVLEGLCEGVTFPSMQGMLSQWAPPLERSRMGTAIYSGTAIGTVVSMASTGVICQVLGWESVFYLYGVCGVVWYVFWECLVYDTPADHPHITEAERDLIEVSLGKRNVHSSSTNNEESHQVKKVSNLSKKVPWKYLLTSRPVWALLVTSVCYAYAGYLVLTEIPTYMYHIQGFNITTVSTL